MEKMSKKQHRLHVKGLLGLSIILSICTGAGVSWFVHRNYVPFVKQTSFVFNYGEPIPTTSDYYFSHNKQYEDVVFDENLFQMKDLGFYEVDVFFYDSYHTISIEIADKNAPAILFSDKEVVQLYRVAGQVQTGDLFTIQDMTQVTIDRISPGLNDLKNGEQEICITARDAYDNTTSQCKTIQIEIVDYALANQEGYSSMEALMRAFLSEHGLREETFGFFYYSIDDEEVYTFNEDGVFNAASTIKVPLNMLYYDKIKEGKIDKDARYVLDVEDVEDEVNTLTEYTFGEGVPLAYLQGESIIHSDNTATNTLVRNLGGFLSFRSLLSNYSDATLPNNFMNENVITPSYMLDVMLQLYEQSDKYSELISNMKKANVGEYLQASSDTFEIAQKYGSFDTYLHTVGIVYTPHPYLIGIYTNDVEDAWDVIPSLNEKIISYQLQKGA